MNFDSIRFQCPSCKIELEVPSDLAGVTGPCPSCQNPIAAPKSSASLGNDNVHPVPTAPLDSLLPPNNSPAPAAAAARLQPVPEKTTPARKKIEPSGKPHTHEPEVYETPDNPDFPVLETVHFHDQKKNLSSTIYMATVIILIAAVIITILNLTGVVGLNSQKEQATEETLISADSPSSNQEKGEQPSADKESESNLDTKDSSSTEASGEKTTEEESNIATSSPNSSNEEELKLPEGEEFREGESPLPAELEEEASNHPEAIKELLEKFIAAESLNDRREFLSLGSLRDPKISRSIFSGKIPKPTSIQFLGHFLDEEEGRTDFFYIIIWDGSKGSPSHPITVELHKWNSNDTPQVNASAFLSAYKSALPRYSSSPSDTPSRFFTLARCLPKCFEDIPGAKEKATLKLFAHPHDTSPVKAYFNRTSDIFKKISAYNSAEVLRQEVPMTLTLNWSEKDGDSVRYLEVITVDSFDWNP